MHLQLNLGKYYILLYGVFAVPKVSFEVCSLEHLAWQAGSVLGMEPTEKTIEQALANNCLTEDLQFK